MITATCAHLEFPVYPLDRCKFDVQDSVDRLELTPTDLKDSPFQKVEIIPKKRKIIITFSSGIYWQRFENLLIETLPGTLAPRLATHGPLNEDYKWKDGQTFKEFTNYFIRNNDFSKLLKIHAAIESEYK